MAASLVDGQTWTLCLLPLTMTGALQVSLVGLEAVVLGCLGLAAAR